jgi:hypothetical protein
MTILLHSSFIVKICHLSLMDNLRSILAELIDTKTGQCKTCGQIHNGSGLQGRAIPRKKRNNKIRNTHLDPSIF